MPKAYALFQYNVANDAKVMEYIPKAVCTVIAHGGTILVATDEQDQREGALPTKRTVIIEFPSKEAAAGWYESAEYQAIVGLRHAGSGERHCVFLPGFVLPRS